MPISRRFLVAPLLLALLVVSAAATADGAGNQTAANALFDEGRRLMAAGNFAEACPKFADSVKLDPGVGTMLNLATCYEKIGRTASAWSEYRDAAAAARDKGQSEREEIARAGVTRLEPKLFKVVVGVSPQAGDDAITLELDGNPTPKGLWGVPAPVDPGKHHVEARAPGKKPWSVTFDVTGPSTPAVTVPVLEGTSVAASAAPARAEPAPPEPMRQDVVPAAGGGLSGQRMAAIAVAGAGVVGVVVGAVFGSMAKATYHDSDPLCNGDRCTAPGRDYRDSGYAKAGIATVAFAVGGAGLVGGAVLWLTAPKKAEGGAGVAVAPFASQTSSGLVVQGAW